MGSGGRERRPSSRIPLASRSPTYPMIPHMLNEPSPCLSMGTVLPRGVTRLHVPAHSGSGGASSRPPLQPAAKSALSPSSVSARAVPRWAISQRGRGRVMAGGHLCDHAYRRRVGRASPRALPIDFYHLIEGVDPTRGSSSAGDSTAVECIAHRAAGANMPHEGVLPASPM
jgi:hypothetical protein